METKTRQAIMQDLIHKFKSPARVASVVGVFRGTAGKWAYKEVKTTAENEAVMMAISYVFAQLARVYREETAMKWLYANNPFLGHHTPVEFIRDGRMAEVDVAIEAALNGGYL